MDATLGERETPVVSRQYRFVAATREKPTSLPFQRSLAPKIERDLLQILYG
jgi:hypothetical protein